MYGFSLFYGAYFGALFGEFVRKSGKHKNSFLYRIGIIISGFAFVCLITFFPRNYQLESFSCSHRIEALAELTQMNMHYLFQI